MADPFATVADLTARGVTVTDQTMAQTFLQDASDFLRGEIGWQVYPTASVTVSDVHGQHTCKAYEMEHIHLPGHPIRSVSSVTMVGQTVDPAYYELVNDVLIVGSAYWYYVQNVGPHWLPIPIVVTYEVGYDTPPAELTAWTCILTADSLDRQSKGLLGRVPMSLAVDDIRVQFSAQQQAGNFPIPDRVLARLRQTYGMSVFVA